MKFIVYLVMAFGFMSQAHADPTNLLRAVIQDDPAAIRVAIERGADPNQTDDNGQIMIGRALLGESYGAALALARHPGLEVERRNRAGETALMLAALKGREDIVQVLIDRGAEIDPTQGWTPLHYAAAGDALPVLKRLLARQVRIDPRSPNGRTPLMLAAAYASEALIDTLLDAGADVAAREPQGRRAADFARGVGRDRLADRLDARATAAPR